MTLHKLTAGDGYTYLTRQVAAHDATARGFSSLGAYYAEKGEAPGAWMGRGLAGVPQFPVTGAVTEAQMLALFGHGRHPNAEVIEARARDAGVHPWVVNQASRLGAPYRVFDQANLFQRRAAGLFRDHNLALGLDPTAPIPAEVRSAIRTGLATDMFIETYGRAPSDARELSGHLARISRQATTSVAGYDLAFSPVKSVSVLWAIAPIETARVIEAAHHAAVADTLTWLEGHATFTRRGRNSVAQVEVHGLIATAFTHRDSRAGDPDLHTHVAISNKVHTLDGHWGALDGRLLYRNAVAASERYNTRLEALLIDRLGVRFADRPGTDPIKRPVREIVGVDGDLPRFWSKRRAAIDTLRAVLAAQFQVDHGRPPTPNEARELADQATLATRARKHEPRAYADQRHTWRAEAESVLGGADRVRDYVHRALAPRRSPRRHPTPTGDERWVERTAIAVLTTVEGARAVWQEHHVRAEAERAARTAGIPIAEVDRAVDAVITRVLSPALSIPLGIREPVTEPALLRRSTGESVYEVAGSRLFTSTAILAAEETILTAAGRRDGRVIPASAVDVALLELVANGVELNPAQIHLVGELATSGARVQLALAPAGAGKTTALRLMARAWMAESGAGSVIGLAPSATAASVLRDELVAQTDTLAKLLWHLNDDPKAWPDWMARIGPKTLVVIDEAGMAGTPDLATVITFITDRGGSVRLVGDDQQLAAIGAGGVLRDIAHTHGAVTLSQVMRFTHPDTGAPNNAEGAASLALRDGDPAAIGYYIDQQRVHVGDTTVADAAYTAWADDTANGRAAIMLAPTRELARDLNERARADRLTALHAPVGREVRLADGTHASAGDVIVTGRNDRRIPLGATDWVKNGDRFTITMVGKNGVLDAVHSRTGRRVTLPTDYVQAHVALGYASTIHGAQGVTADTCYAVLTGQETRQLLYVAATRGRHANHLYLTTAGDGDPHAVITRDALLPPTAVDILTRILARDAAPVSAHTQARDLTDPAQQLGKAADRYFDALTTAAVDVLGPDRMALIDTHAERIIAGITTAATYPTLRGHLALLALDGADPIVALTAAAGNRELGSAFDVAAVLDWRLQPTRSPKPGPLQWLPPIPTALNDDPLWGPYLTSRDVALRDFATKVRTNATAWTPATAPPWAVTLIDRNLGLVADLAVWRAANHAADNDPAPTGPPLPDTDRARAQQALNQRAHQLLGDPHAATARWAVLAAGVDPRLSADPYWPVLADRLIAADRAGIDVVTLVQAAAGQRHLPDEMPAAALWWRLAEHLTPATVTGTGDAGSALSQDLAPLLADVLGEPAAHRVVLDPAWPALVAATNRAHHNGWTPQQVLAAAYELLSTAQPDDAPLRLDELTTALVWRITMLTTDSKEHPDSRGQRVGSHRAWHGTDDDFADSVHALDDDWFASLTEPTPADSVRAEWHDVTAASPVETNPAKHLEQRPPAQEVDPARRATIGHPPQSQPQISDNSVTPARIAELNRQAAEFYSDCYRESWAPTYLTQRLGTDLSEGTNFIVGYAPQRWTALSDYLRSKGADDQEIVAAGLGSYASTGRVINRFRDRLMFAIQDGDRIDGWIGRRNPHRIEDDSADPKYVNTPQTALFTKGNELFGLAEAGATLAAGAALVLVEGPLDAIAVTLAGRGDYVGVAPLGTALTDNQTDLLRPFIHPDAPGIIIATDDDPAGRHAAERAFWKLTDHGDDPRVLAGQASKDPAEIMGTRGAQHLYDGLAGAANLGAVLVVQRIAKFTDSLDTVEGRVHATRRAAEVIAALPPSTWSTHVDTVIQQTGVGLETAINEVLGADDQRNSREHETLRRHDESRDPTDLHNRPGHQVKQVDFDPARRHHATKSATPSPHLTR
ncbi:MAG: dnaG3 [Pseudonocardiales bacterium]|nr:dnaG3 [Pseudonocardiales bacterium]